MASSLTWEEMIERLLEIFDSEVVNIEEVEAVLEEYQSCQSDWEKYAKFDQYKYTRNLVHRGMYVPNSVVNVLEEFQSEKKM